MKAKFGVYSIAFDFTSSMNLRNFYKFIKFTKNVVKPETIGIFEFSEHSYKMEKGCNMIFCKESRFVYNADFIQNIQWFRNNITYLASLLNPESFNKLYTSTHFFKDEYYKLFQVMVNNSEEMKYDSGSFKVKINDLISNDEDLNFLYIHPFIQNPYRYKTVSLKDNDEVKDQIIQKYGDKELSGPLKLGYLKKPGTQEMIQYDTAIIKDLITVPYDGYEVPLLFVLQIKNIKNQKIL